MKPNSFSRGILLSFATCKQLEEADVSMQDSANRAWFELCDMMKKAAEYCPGHLEFSEKVVVAVQAIERLAVKTRPAIRAAVLPEVIGAVNAVLAFYK